jgi:hypothetical protein
MTELADLLAQSKKTTPTASGAAEMQRLIVRYLDKAREMPPLVGQLVGQIFCPVCKTQHVDAVVLTPHKTHACQSCGLVWRPFGDVPTIGVQFLPGMKDETSQ